MVDTDAESDCQITPGDTAFMMFAATVVMIQVSFDIAPA
jgi:hypothetical protein